MGDNMINWIKEKVKTIFGGTAQVKVEDKEQPSLMVRMDILKHKMSDEKREEIRKNVMEHSNSSTFDVKSDILDNRDSDNLEQVFNSLPMSGLSDEAKAKVIDIVYLDQWERNQRLLRMMENTTTKGTTEFDELNHETNKNLNK